MVVMGECVRRGHVRVATDIPSLVEARELPDQFLRGVKIGLLIALKPLEDV